MQINVKAEDMPEFTNQIIEVFENFLSERDIVIPTSVKEMEDDNSAEGNDAVLYGSDYGEILDGIEEVLREWASEIDV